MKIIIFEGIAASGKSTTINSLIKSLPGTINAKVFTEQSTHIPIIGKTNELCKDFFTKLVSEAVSSDYDVVLFDRLYLTQAFRAKSLLNAYLDIEMLLFTNSVVTIFLKVDELEISKRLSNAIQHRNPSWGEYVSTKGKTLEEQVAYYINQQINQLNLLSQSKLPYKVYNTTPQNSKSIVKDLRKIILADL